MIERDFETTRMADGFLESLKRKSSDPEKKLYKSEIRGILKEAQGKSPEEVDAFISSSLGKITKSHFAGFPEELRHEFIHNRLEYVILDISLKTLHDRRLSGETREKRLSLLEKITDSLGAKSEEFTSASVLIFSMRKEKNMLSSDAIDVGEEIVKKGFAALQIAAGAACGFFGADLAEKYAGVMPQVQVMAGVSMAALLFARKQVTLPENFEGIDKFLDKFQTFFYSFAAGFGAHGLAGFFEGSGKTAEVKGLAKNIKPKAPSATPVTPVVPELPQINSPSVLGNLPHYQITGKEVGGLTDVLAHFGKDPYGSEMTKFILQNKTVLTDHSRRGWQAAYELVKFLEAHPGYTWRDAMNESARAGRATDVSKIFTEALRFVRPGTVFQAPWD